ncbi:hypothetical protein [Dechloromonas hortensis]|uniref:hypothetical protein n=1 Tax=Dechloromonas hortensis TaxID=337779 RepID=UPI001291A15A|nr:hypothetical protein [Dechloromonas hortensis]
MHPVHDVDALLLLAMMLSAKRRPAELVEVVAAADLIQGNVPAEQKLVEAFERLGVHGLLAEADGGYTLTPAAQEIVATKSRKADMSERVFTIKDKLSVYEAKGESAPVSLTLEQVTAAILAHRATEKTTVKNLLVAKPKPEGGTSRPGQRQRKPMPAKKRKL